MEVTVRLGKARLRVDLWRFVFGDGRWVVKANRTGRRFGG